MTKNSLKLLCGGNPATPDKCMRCLVQAIKSCPGNSYIGFEKGYHVFNIIEGSFASWQEQYYLSGYLIVEVKEMFKYQYKISSHFCYIRGMRRISENEYKIYLVCTNSKRSYWGHR